MTLLAHAIAAAPPASISHEGLRGRPLRVDTGDVAVDASLAGYTRVVVDYNREIVYPVAS